MKKVFEMEWDFDDFDGEEYLDLALLDKLMYTVFLDVCIDYEGNISSFIHDYEDICNFLYDYHCIDMFSINVLENFFYTLRENTADLISDFASLMDCYLLDLIDGCITVDDLEV